MKFLISPAFLFCSAIAIVAAPVEWSPTANMDNQLFPSLVIATATQRPDADEEQDPEILGDQYGLLGVSIKSPAAHTKVTVTLRENALMNASSWSGELENKDTDYYVAPKINYKFDQLRKARQQVPLNVTFAVEVNGKPAGEQHETVSVHSINDCPYAVSESEETIDTEPEGGSSKPASDDESSESSDESDNSASSDSSEAKKGSSAMTDMGWMFAAYVNEGSPIADKVLKEALATQAVNHFAGYQGTPDDVLREVFAVWTALQNRGIHYSSITTTPGGSDLVYHQHVRFVEESLQNEQANCVDGSVLFASVLRKIGLRTFLVILPGHMYMGVYVSAQGDDRVAIETTMIGAPAAADQEKVKTIKPLRALKESLDPKLRDSASWRSFERAVAEGTSNLNTNREKFESDDPNYQIIDVGESRNEGIMPISSDGA